MADFTWLERHLTEEEKRTGPLWVPRRSCVLINTDVNVQVVALVMAAGCGKHDPSRYAYQDGTRRMILQFKPHFLPEMRINNPDTHAWGLEGVQASFLNTGKDRLDCTAPANNGKRASYLLSSRIPSNRSLIPLQYFSVGNFVTNNIPDESALCCH